MPGHSALHLERMKLDTVGRPVCNTLPESHRCNPSHRVRQEGSWRRRNTTFRCSGTARLQAVLHEGRRPPVRRGRMGSPRRRHPQLQGGRQRLRAAGRRVPRVVVPERHQHRGAEVLPRSARHPAARVERPPDDLPGGRHHHGLGHQGRLFRERRGRARVLGRAHAPAGHAEGRVQLAGLVQRGRRGSSAVQRLLHPRRRGLHALDPQLVHRGGDDLQGRLGIRREPVPAALVGRAAPRRRDGQRSGLVHARRRRQRRDDQVGGQDASRGQDGRAERRPPRRPRLHLVQGRRGTQGAGPSRRRVRHGPGRQGLVLDAVPEREQLGAGDRRVHAGGTWTTATGS